MKPKTSQKKSAQFKVNLDLLHTTYDEHHDVKGNLSDMSAFDWHELSVYGKGIQFHLDAKMHRAHLRFFSGMEDLSLKKGCFHPHNRNCTCNSSPRASFRPKADASQEAMKAMLARSRSINNKCEYLLTSSLHHTACREGGAFRRRPRRKIIFNKVWTVRYTQDWDHTLGYEGEGPSLKIVSQNLRGALTGTTWEDATQACKFLKAHIVCYQEVNLKRGDPRIQQLAAVAKRLGFTAHFTFTSTHTTTGGTATLVADSLNCSRTAFRSLRQGSCSVATLTIPGLDTPSNKIKIVNVYGSQSGNERVAQFQKVAKHVNKWTALVGDFNVVLDAALDVRRTSSSPYPTVGADELSAMVTTNDLHDEIREGLGLGFEFTHQQTTPSGTCCSRIDRHYLPTFAGGQWTSEICDSVVSSDHSAVISTLTFVDRVRGSDVYTLNANLIKHPSIHARLHQIIIEIVEKKWEKGESAVACMKKLKHEVRKLLRNETRKHAKKTNAEIESIEMRLRSLHNNQCRSSTTEGVSGRKVLQAKLVSLRSTLRPPKASSSRFRHLKEECMSRQFWSSAFSGSRASSLIQAMKKVADWSSPPEKDDTTCPTTTEVANAAADFYSHIGKLPE